MSGTVIKLILGATIGILIMNILLCIFPKSINYYKGYKQGQIDAIIGRVKYKAVSETKWVEIKEEK